MKKILTCVITAILLMTSLLLGGCDSKAFGEYLAKYGEGEIMTKGDFVYGYIHEAGASRRSYNGEYVVILELSAEGKQKDTIIIPDEIDGKPVIQIGMVGLAFSYDLKDGTYSRVYLSKNVEVVTSTMGPKVYSLVELNENFLKYNSFWVYVSTEMYEVLLEKYKDTEIRTRLSKANVAYESDGEIFWIEDYNYESLLNPPVSEPIKEGYSFKGWYKEPECINVWDFENDKVPSKERDELGNWISFNETRLYAKWEKSN